MENKCKNCNKEITASKRFCDVACYNLYKKTNQVELTCTFCNKKFSVSKKRSEEVSHCSRKCYIQSANEAGQRICKDCKQLKPIEQFNTHSPAKAIRRRYCIECEKKRVRTRATIPKERWNSAKRRAAKSGEVWDISLESFETLLLQPCHYCDGVLNPTGCGLDRKNNEVGYTLENVVPCCQQCNIVKNHFFTYEEMMTLAVTIRQIKNNRMVSNSH